MSCVVMLYEVVLHEVSAVCMMVSVSCFVCCVMRCKAAHIPALYRHVHIDNSCNSLFKYLFAYFVYIWRIKKYVH